MGETRNRWQLGELVAVMWNDEMAARFPSADHTLCRVEVDSLGRVLRCMGWHCNRCGAPTNYQGGHNCPDRPERDHA